MMANMFLVFLVIIFPFLLIFCILIRLALKERNYVPPYSYKIEFWWLGRKGHWKWVSDIKQSSRNKINGRWLWIDDF